MARKGQHSFSKRQRERKKAEKAALKQARRAASRESDAPVSETAEDHPRAEDDDLAASN